MPSELDTAYAFCMGIFTGMMLNERDGPEEPAELGPDCSEDDECGWDEDTWTCDREDCPNG